MAQNRANSSSFIETEQYSSFILRNLHDGLLPQHFYRNVSDFTHGTNLTIKTVGSVTIQDVAEDVAVDFTPIESGTINMVIDRHVGDGWYVTDELKEDGAQIDALMTARSIESTRALKEEFESSYLRRAVTALTPNNPNLVNGFAHTLVASGAGNTLTFEDVLAMRLAFDKANVPAGGRVAIVDPITAASFAKMVTLTHDTNEFARSILANGFDRDHNYIMTIHGFHVFTSNRLPRGTYGDGTNTVADGVANVFMSVADDNTKPLMAAWRRMPSLRTLRNEPLRRQEFMTTARYGFGVQRLDTIGVIITSATTY